MFGTWSSQQLSQPNLASTAVFKAWARENAVVEHVAVELSSIQPGTCTWVQAALAVNILKQSSVVNVVLSEWATTPSCLAGLQPGWAPSMDAQKLKTLAPSLGPYFSGELLSALSDPQFAALASNCDAMKTLSTNAWAAITPTRISSLSPEDVACVQPAIFAELTCEQIGAFTHVQIDPSPAEVYVFHVVGPCSHSCQTVQLTSRRL